jgi:hypothetical protein
MAEKRSAPRTQTFLKAEALCDDGRPPTACLVIDISPTGARLQPADGVAVHDLPEQFQIHVLRSGARYQVRVAWRTNDELGVAFDVPPA